MTDTVPVTDAPPAIPTRGPVAVLAEGVDIRYRVYEDKAFSARRLVSGGFTGRGWTEVHAVKDLSVTIRVGESVGIVGSNGSGKSTFLRAIAGLQSLASGSLRVRGEVGLLGVGAALKPSLSGYRNVFLGGLAVGMSEDEIEAKLPEIIEFSGLDAAMGRPMKTYSSGMKARLAFSISTLKIPDILLIDEALAVGDKEFRAKSLAKLNEIRAAAGTIVMVTHNLSEIRQSCTRAIWIDDGVLRADGDVDTVLGSYEAR